MKKLVFLLLKQRDRHTHTHTQPQTAAYWTCSDVWLMNSRWSGWLSWQTSFRLWFRSMIQIIISGWLCSSVSGCWLDNTSSSSPLLFPSLSSSKYLTPPLVVHHPAWSNFYFFFFFLILSYLVSPLFFCFIQNVFSHFSLNVFFSQILT